MISADLARMLTQGATAGLLLAGRAHVWELLISNDVLSAGTSFYRPASTGIVAEIVSKDKLQAANSLLSISDNTASFGGPALSGILVATAGPGFSFLIDAISFGASAILLSAIPLHQRASVSQQPFLMALAEGWKELTARRWYWLSLISHALWNLAVAVLFVLGPVIARDHLDGAVGWGLVSAGLSAGAVLGGFIALRVQPRRPLLAGNLALALGAAPLLALALGLPLAVVIVGSVLAFAGMAFLNGLWLTAIQQLFPAATLARVSSYDSLVSYVVMPVGYAVAGPAAAAGAGPALTAAAALMLVPSVSVALTGSVRGIRRGPDGTLREKAAAGTEAAQARS